MDNFDYEKIMRLCFAYHSIGLQEHRVISFLAQTGKFIGSASHLGRQMDILPSNILKALNRLENAGIIYVEKDEKNHMAYCNLVDNWMEVVIKRVEDGAVLYAKQRTKSEEVDE